MDQYKVIYRNEKYMDDATSSIFYNINETVKRREEECVWGPIKLSNSSKRVFETELDKIYQNVFRTDNDPTVSLKMPKVMHGKEVRSETSCRDEKNDKHFSRSYSRISDDMQNDICTEDENMEVGNAIDQSSRKKTSDDVKKAIENKSTKLDNARNNRTSESQTDKVSTNKFQDWCNKRSKEFEKIKCTSTLNQLTTNSKISIQQKKVPIVSKEDAKIKANNIRIVKDVKKNARSKRSDNLDADKRLPIHAYSEKSLHSVKETSPLCIEIADEKDDKKYEFMSDLPSILAVKRIFPDLSEIIPGVDSGSKKINYSAEAVNIILRFVLNRNYKPDAMPSPVTGVEVLGATQSWKIQRFHEIFQKDFLEKVLSPDNVNLIFYHACHFDLKEVCDACKSIVSDATALNCLNYKRRQKTSCVTVSTYIEPLEFCIPFHPTDKGFAISFDRHIQNKIVFEAISNCYVITGVQIQLNEDHLQINSHNSMLDIDYSIKNITDNNEIDTGREKKPLRPKNSVYFKKSLVVNRGQIGEITVEMDIKPYLCSALLDEKMEVRNSAEKFNLTLISGFKIRESDSKLFIIGKLFYSIM